MRALVALCACLAAAAGGGGGSQPQQPQAPPTASSSSTADLSGVTANDVPAWVISLKRTPWRLALFRQASAAERIFPQLKVFEAVDGRTLDLEHDARISAYSRVVTQGNDVTGTTGILQRKRHADVATRGMIGLYISHVEIWRAFLETGAPVGVVFEDDARVPSDGDAAFNALLANMPPPDTWDVWFLGLLQMFDSAPAPRAFGPGWVRPTAFFGTQSYLVTRRGAARLLGHAYPCTMQVDAFMATMSSLGQVVAVTRTDKSVQWSQFGLVTGTTVQNMFCDACDLPAGWHREGDERWFRVLGAVIGLVLACVPAYMWQSLVRGLTRLCCCACCSRCAHRVGCGGLLSRAATLGLAGTVGGAAAGGAGARSGRSNSEELQRLSNKNEADDE